MDTGSDKGAVSVLQRALVGLLSALRRMLSTINQVVFRDRLQHIDEYATYPLFEPVERRVLAYADAMTALPPTVTDSQVAELEAELGRAGLIELTHSIALENMRARAYHALGIVDQGFDTACQVRLSG